MECSFKQKYMKSTIATLSFLCYLLSLWSQPIVLTPDQTLTQQIGPGEIQHFSLSLNTNEMVFVRFMQEGADVMIKVLDPTGEEIGEFDGDNGRNGPELVHIIPELEGTYILEVRTFENQKKQGTYKVSIDEKIEKAKTSTEQLDQLIQYWEKQGYLPGFGVATVTKDKVLFQKGYGFADLEEKRPYTIQTIQNIGSVSKTLIGISIMKAIEEGKLTLDTKANEVLPYKVINPYHPDKAITLKQLATHTSSINEMPAYEKSYILKQPFRYAKGEISKYEYKMASKYANNKDRPMGEYLSALLDKEGDLYSKKSYLKAAPGETYSYSNAGATVAADMIAIAYDMPYDEFTKTHILKPLGMKHSGWSFETIELEKHTDLHFNNFKVIPRYSLITYPDGGLLTNIQDLTLYLQAMMKGYDGEESLIQPDSYQLMMQEHLSESQRGRTDRNYGIFWELRENEIGHSGGDPGIVCLFRFNTETGVGRVMMTNIMPQGIALTQFVTIWRWLDQFGHEMVEVAKTP